MTLIALDPIRDAVFKTAFDAHLNAAARRRDDRWHDVAAGRGRSVRAHDHRRCPARSPGWRCDAIYLQRYRRILVGATCWVRPMRRCLRSAPPPTRTCRRSASSPRSIGYSTTAAHTGCARPATARPWQRRRCGACCATPSSTRRCSAVPARCSTPVGPSAPSTANSGGHSGRCTALRSSRLHGAVRVVPHPPRPLVDPRQRTNRRRQSAAAMRGPPSPRARGRLDAHNDARPGRHLDATGWHRMEVGQHRRPRRRCPRLGSATVKQE